MKLLVLAPSFPVPITDGHTLRVRHLLRSLPEGYDFDLLCEVSTICDVLPADPSAEIGPRCRSVTFLRRDEPIGPCSPNPLWRRIHNVLFPHELSPGYVLSNSMKKELAGRFGSGAYDLVLYCGFSMFLYGKMLGSPLPYVVNLIDSYSLYCRNELGEAGKFSPWLRALSNLIWAIRYEQKHCSSAKNIVLITPRDQVSLQANCRDARTWVVPNGVDADYFCPGASSAKENHLLFTGVMDYEPNVNSMLFFIEEVLPKIRSEIPGTILTIAGKNPVPSLVTAASNTQGIFLTGEVEDIRPFFEQAAVYVAPMTSGAGLKNKILEAWAMAKPVVATSMACSGISVADGENILVANDPNDFARQVIAVLRDEVLGARMSMASRKVAESEYSWKLQGQKFVDIFDEVACEKTSRYS